MNKDNLIKELRALAEKAGIDFDKLIKKDEEKSDDLFRQFIKKLYTEHENVSFKDAIALSIISYITVNKGEKDTIALMTTDTRNPANYLLLAEAIKSLYKSMPYFLNQLKDKWEENKKEMLKNSLDKKTTEKHKQLLENLNELEEMFFKKLNEIDLHIKGNTND